MIRRPPRSTLDRSSAASDVYKRQVLASGRVRRQLSMLHRTHFPGRAAVGLLLLAALLRLGTNLSRVDELNPEELYRGALAQAWVQGAPVWPGAAPQVEHLRGSLLVS